MNINDEINLLNEAEAKHLLMKCLKTINPAIEMIYSIVKSRKCIYFISRHNNLIAFLHRNWGTDVWQNTKEALIDFVKNERLMSEDIDAKNIFYGCQNLDELKICLDLSNGVCSEI